MQQVLELDVVADRPGVVVGGDVGVGRQAVEGKCGSDHPGVHPQRVDQIVRQRGQREAGVGEALFLMEIGELDLVTEAELMAPADLAEAGVVVDITHRIGLGACAAGARQ